MGSLAAKLAQRRQMVMDVVEPKVADDSDDDEWDDDDSSKKSR